MSLQIRSKFDKGSLQMVYIHWSEVKMNFLTLLITFSKYVKITKSGTNGGVFIFEHDPPNLSSTWIPDLFLQNDIKHRKAGSTSSDCMWELFSFSPNLPLMSISSYVPPHPDKFASE